MDKTNSVDMLDDDIIGDLLRNRYEVVKFLDKGSNGEVYKVTD